MDKPIYFEIAIIEMSKFLMYETNYDKLQNYFEQEKLQIHHMDTDSFVLSMKTKDIIKDLKNLEDIFDLCNLNEDHSKFSN